VLRRFPPLLAVPAAMLGFTRLATMPGQPAMNSDSARAIDTPDAARPASKPVAMLGVPAP